MDPQTLFCPNSACPASGQVGKGNIGVPSVKEGRYKCHECGQTFAVTKGTLFYRLRSAKELAVIVVTLLAHGCPLQAIVAAFGLDERTVLSWQARSGKHCQGVHEHLVERGRDLGQVQADEIRAKTQGSLLWMAGPRAWAADPVADILRNWWGGEVDLSYYEQPGHEFDSAFDVRRIERELGFVAQRLPWVKFFFAFSAPSAVRKEENRWPLDN